MSEEAPEPLKLTVRTSANTIYALECLKQHGSIENTGFNIGENLEIGKIGRIVENRGKFGNVVIFQFFRK